MENNIGNVPCIDISRVKDLVKLDYEKAPRSIYELGRNLEDAVTKLIESYNDALNKIVPMGVRHGQWTTSDSAGNRKIKAGDVVFVRRLYFDEDLFLNGDEDRLARILEDPDILKITSTDEIKKHKAFLLESPRVLIRTPIDEIKGYLTCFAFKYDGNSAKLHKYESTSLSEIARSAADDTLDFEISISVADYCRVKRELQSEYSDCAAILQIAGFGKMEIQRPRISRRTRFESDEEVEAGKKARAAREASRSNKPPE